MIKKYKEFLTEKLTDNLSGFNTDELLQQLIEHKISFRKYLETCKEYEIIVNKEKLKQLLLSEKLEESFEIFYTLCNEYNIQMLTEDEIIDILKINDYDDYYNILIDSIKFKLNKIFYNTIKNVNIEDNLQQLLKIISMYGNIHAFEYFYKTYDVNVYMLNNMLMYASNNSQFDMIKTLVKYGADIYDNDNKITRNAVIDDNFKMFEFLIKNYYDIKNDSRILLRLAIRNQKSKYIDYLINNGAIVDENIFNISMYGNIEELLKKYYNEQHD